MPSPLEALLIARFDFVVPRSRRPIVALYRRNQQLAFRIAALLFRAKRNRPQTHRHD
jgi:hypothetical protein